MTRKKKKSNQKSPKLNAALLEKHMTEMAMATLTGQAIPSTSIDVTVDIPTPMLEIAKHYAEVSGQDTKVIVAQMVKEGLSYKMQALAKEAMAEQGQADAPQTETVDPKAGLDKFQEAMGNMGTLKDLMNTLNSLSESLEGIQNNGTNPAGNLLKIR